MPLVADLASISKKQGVVATVALALAAALVYFVRIQAGGISHNTEVLDQLVASTDALGDLVISSCDPDEQEVRKFHAAKRHRARPAAPAAATPPETEKAPPP